MSAFRFRAAHLLDLRRQQEDQARAAFAAAEAGERAAAGRVEQAHASAAEAVSACQHAERDGIGGAELGWHRSWIGRQRLDVERRRCELAAAAAVSAAAAAQLRTAHRRRRMLERLRDRAWRAYREEAARRDAREMDALAALRHFMNESERKEAHEHHQHDVEHRHHGDGG